MILKTSARKTPRIHDNTTSLSCTLFTTVRGLCIHKLLTGGNNAKNRPFLMVISLVFKLKLIEIKSTNSRLCEYKAVLVQVSITTTFRNCSAGYKHDT